MLKILVTYAHRLMAIKGSIVNSEKKSPFFFEAEIRCKNNHEANLAALKRNISQEFQLKEWYVKMMMVNKKGLIF